MRVRVSAPSHVHVGNIDIHGGIGRLYGTLGFALESPRLVVEVEASKEPGVEPRDPDIMRFLEIYGEHLGTTARVRVLESIPGHVGLGSTTAKALAVGAALSIISGTPRDPAELAVLAGRSLVSALGLYAFTHGGFIVDGGFKPDVKRPPPLIYRAPVPSWLRIVVALPDTPKLEEILALKEREDEVLESMPPMPEEQAAANARLVLMGVLPSVAEGDWYTAAGMLYRLNSGLGEYWAERQEGRYCCREVEELVRAMIDAGALCSCQSSWGPTTYALVPEERVDRVLGAARGVPGKAWATRVDNLGARIEVLGHG